MSQYNDEIKKYAEKHGVPFSIGSALVGAESSYDAGAVGPETKYGTAKGLMQLLDETAADYNENIDPFDPDQNLDAGMEHLGRLGKKYNGNWEQAILAYHAGEGNVDNGKVGPQSRAYLAKIKPSIPTDGAATQAVSANTAPAVEQPVEQPVYQTAFPKSTAGELAELEQTLPQERQYAITDKANLPQLSDFAHDDSPYLNLSFEPEPPVEEDLGMLGRIALANREFSITQQGVQAALQPELYKSDPAYRPSEHMYLIDDLPTEYHEQLLSEPVSLADAIATKDRMLNEMAVTQKVMGSNLIAGTVAMGLGSLIDPIMSVGMIGEARIFNTVRNASRLTRFAASAASGGTIAGAEMALVAYNKETVNASDAVMMIGFAAGISGALGAAFRKAGVTDVALLREADRVDAEASTLLVKQADTADTQFNNIDITDTGDTNVLGRSFEERSAQADIEFQAAEDAWVLAADEAKAAGRDIPALPKKPTVEHSTRIEDVTSTANARESAGTLIKAAVFDTKVGKALLSKYHLTKSDFVRFASSKSNMARLWATEYLEDASGIGGRMVNKTAGIVKEINEGRLLQMYQESMRSGYAAHRKATNKGMFSGRMGSAKDEFNSILRLELEGRHNAALKGTKHVSDAPDYIRRVADDIDKSNADGVRMLRDAGVFGADELKPIPGYVKLIWTPGRVAKAITQGTIGRYEKLLSSSYISMGISEAAGGTIAKAVLRRAKNSAIGIDSNPAYLFSKEGLGVLEEILVDGNVAANDIRAIMKQVSPSDQAGKPSSFKRRASVDLTMRDGDIGLMDLVDNDMSTLLRRSTSQTAGRAALARKGLKSDLDVQVFRDALAEDLNRVGDPNFERILQAFDNTIDEFMGRPVAGGRGLAVRSLMDYATLSRLGQVGYAQIAEWNNVLASHGVLKVLQAVPRAMKMAKQMRAAAKANDWSKVDQGFMRELQVFGGRLDDEHLLHNVGVDLDEVLDPSWTSGTLKALDHTRKSSMEALGHLSGLYKVKGMQQRINVILQTQKVIDVVKKGGKQKDYLAKRMLDSGLSGKTLARVEKELRHVTYVKGSDNIVDKLNLEKWDASTREDFVASMHRHTKQVIQLPMIGERNYWQSQTMGALLMQFKSFAVLANEKQAARHLIAGDRQSLAALYYGSGLSILAGTGKVLSNSLGREDADEYLKERMTMPNMVGMSINYASVLSPFGFAIGGLDSAGALPEEFGGRNPRKGSMPGFQNLAASAGWVNDVGNVALSPVQGIQEGKFDTAKETQALIGVAPMGNTLPAVWLSNLVGNFKSD